MRVELKCDLCSKVYTTQKSWIRSNKHFCSRECQAKGRTKLPKTYVRFNCEECGISCKSEKNASRSYKYCSIQCMSKVRGRNMRGSNHPFWNGGTTERTWKSKAVIRKKKQLITSCEECGSKDDLQGHHISHYSKDVTNRESIDNIKILCINCHANEHENLKHFIKGL